MNGLLTKIENILNTKYYHRDRLSISNPKISRLYAFLAALSSYALIALAVYWYRTRISKLKNSINNNISLKTLIL